MKLFSDGELKILWPFYLEYFISSLLYFMPVFMILYLSRLNFSFTQIGILLAIYPLTSLIFEIPTGAIADLYGRKFSVLFGYFIEGICMLGLFFFENYFKRITTDHTEFSLLSGFFDSLSFQSIR